jgi:NAD(P)-dependent dehydrogenase (short-subunit alcohol dehydrogenase family)
MNFENKIVVVTGAAEGIGRAIALTFARQGAAVALLDTNPQAMQQAASLIPTGASSLALKVDVGIESEVASAFEEIVDRFGRIDVLVNNAGIQLYKDFLDFSTSEWHRLLAVNLNGVYYCSKQALPHMIRSGGGAIVNISSVQALATTGQVSPYAAAKGGILSLTRDMAREFGKNKIRINAICPGCIDTPMMDRTLVTMADPGTVVKKMISAIPLQRLGKPQDIANVALFLASSYAEYISGVSLIVDGGLMSKLPLPEYW